MMNSAYLKSEKASTTLGLTLSHLVCFRRHQGNKIVPQHLVPTSPPKHNQRFPSVRGCFNGGQSPIRLDFVDSATDGYLILATFKAPSGRQLIADKGSIDGGLRSLEPADTLAKGPDGVRNLEGMMRNGRNSFDTSAHLIRATFRAALPERCFRYLDCFNGGMVSGWFPVFVVNSVDAKPERRGSVTSKAVFIPSNLDRNIKDNQGGCLYEWPDSQNVLNGARESKKLSLGLGLQRVKRPTSTHRVPDGGRNSGRAPFKAFWQKPGIGVAAVSPVPKRDIHKGEGTDYPYLQDTVRGKAIAMEINRRT